ncbi:DnaJ domain-containing protein [Legionella brunensis]|uniref:Molecular chaperone DnaJ n=1 Tax=Legionella brunensis TaxID=29422 RepID=A0A0W0SNL7_9GAMM|nr:DnaJ domain-containing protein [Legionella brunensis]KTC84975.1 molecular chaperone DnaJ [Legionella brunensis]
MAIYLPDRFKKAPFNGNYYQIFEIKIDASQEEITKAYKRLALVYHPDKAKGSPSAEEVAEREECFIAIKEIYDVLSDPSLKSLYDIGERNNPVPIDMQSDVSQAFVSLSRDMLQVINPNKREIEIYATVTQDNHPVYVIGRETMAKGEGNDITFAATLDNLPYVEQRAYKDMLDYIAEHLNQLYLDQVANAEHGAIIPIDNAKLLPPLAQGIGKEAQTETLDKSFEEIFKKRTDQLRFPVQVKKEYVELLMQRIAELDPKQEKVKKWLENFKRCYEYAAVWNADPENKKNYPYVQAEVKTKAQASNKKKQEHRPVELGVHFTMDFYGNYKPDMKLGATVTKVFSGAKDQLQELAGLMGADGVEPAYVNSGFDDLYEFFVAQQHIPTLDSAKINHARETINAKSKINSIEGNFWRGIKENNIPLFKQACEELQANEIEIPRGLFHQRSPIAYSLVRGASLDIIQYLVETLKLNLHAPIEQGKSTLMHEMVKYGSPEIVRYLLSQMTNTGAIDALLCAQTSKNALIEGETPLHACIRHIHMPFTIMDLNTKEEVLYGVEAFQERLAVLEILLMELKGKNLSLTHQNKKGKTAADYLKELIKDPITSAGNYELATLYNKLVEQDIKLTIATKGMIPLGGVTQTQEKEEDISFKSDSPVGGSKTETQEKEEDISFKSDSPVGGSKTETQGKKEEDISFKSDLPVEGSKTEIQEKKEEDISYQSNSPIEDNVTQQKKFNQVEMIVQRITGSKKHKYEKQELLLQEINSHKLSVEEFNTLYKKVKKIADLNAHRNPYLDGFFGIKNTTSWRKTLEQFRTVALENLFQELNDITDNRMKLNYLALAKEMPLFKEHRNNSVFSGAWGRTSAVKKIEELEEEIRLSVANSPVIQP